jgi:hypothetical protein
MLNSTYTWSHARGNAVVPSRWQATFAYRTAVHALNRAMKCR